MKNYFAETSMAAVRNRISGMNDDDLAKQCALIRESFGVQEMLIRNSNGRAAEPVKDERKPGKPDRERLIEAVQAIADYICDRAIITGTSVNWLNTVTGVNPYVEMKVMKGNLYNGRAGVCLFLCSCLKILGRRANIKLSQTVLVDELIKIADWHLSEASRSELIGAGKGIGGIIYTLVKVWELTGDELLLARALQLSRAISDRLIDSDAEYDITSGSAGAILGLLALYGACPSDGVLQRAVCCADHLLACRVEGDGGLKAWKPSSMFTIDNRPVPALARGASGIGLALGRLYQVSGQVKYLQAAREALRYENDLLREKKFVWPGLNGQSPGVQLCWSTGAAGICLNRLEAGNILGTGQRDRDLQTTLDLIGSSGDLGKDNLGWGNFGLIDVLVSASCKLDDDRLYNEALTRAARYLEGFTGFNGNIHDLSFFEGISGIGYVLLRLVERRLPSVLAFE